MLLFSTFLFAQISIQNAWQHVLNGNDALKASKSDIRHAQLKKESAEGMYLPSVSITGSYTHLNDPIGIDISSVSHTVNPVLGAIGGKALPDEIDFLDQNIALVDLQVLYPFYMGGKIDAAQDAYAGKVLEAKAKHRMEKDKAFLRLIKLYYGVVMTKAVYNTRVASQKALQLHYDHAVKLKAQGQLSRAEVLNARVKFDMAKIETTKASHKVAIVNAAFHKMIKSNTDPKSSLFVSKKLGSRHKYTSQSLKHHAAIEVLNAKSKQALAMTAVEEAAWYPEVLGYANMNLYKGDSPMEEMAPNWLVGVGVKFDIFSRKDRAKEVEAAKVRQYKVSSLKAQAKEDLSLAVQKTYNEILLYKDEFDALSSSLALSRENFKLRSLAFKEGLATSVEVADAQTLLTGAQTQRLNAAYNYVKKLAELCVLSGDATLFFKFAHTGQGIH